LISLATTALSILAQTGTTVTSAPVAPATTRPGWMGLLDSGLFPIVIGIMILYLFVFRSKKKEGKKREDMLAQLSKGDEVVTIGGEIGKVIETRDNRVLLKVDESSNTKIWYLRSAIHRVMDDEKKAEVK
jgi:preprotein translocase subunit YajC